MKYLFIFIAVIGLGNGGTSTPVENQRDVNADFNEFLELLPLDEILNIYISFLYDPEFQQVLLYIFSNDFKNLVIEVEAIPEYDAVIGFIDEAGLPVKQWVQGIHDALGIIPTGTEGARAEGIRGFVDAIKAVIDWRKLEEFYFYKTENSPEFRSLFEKISTPEFTGFVDGLVANQRIQNIAVRLVAAGIDVQFIIDSLKNFFNYPNF